MASKKKRLSLAMYAFRRSTRDIKSARVMLKSISKEANYKEAVEIVLEGLFENLKKVNNAIAKNDDEMMLNIQESMDESEEESKALSKDPLKGKGKPKVVILKEDDLPPELAAKLKEYMKEK